MAVTIEVAMFDQLINFTIFRRARIRKDDIHKK